MTGLLVLAIDRDVAGHLAVALRRHRDALQRNGLAEPEGLAQLQEMAVRVVSGTHEASASGSVLADAETGWHEREYLSRDDVRRLTGASLATIDRWIRSGKLPSCKHGRTRRIARTDLQRLLAAA